MVNFCEENESYDCKVIFLILLTEQLFYKIKDDEGHQQYRYTSILFKAFTMQTSYTGSTLLKASQSQRLSLNRLQTLSRTRTIFFYQRSRTVTVHGGSSSGKGGGRSACQRSHIKSAVTHCQINTSSSLVSYV